MDQGTQTFRVNAPPSAARLPTRTVTRYLNVGDYVDVAGCKAAAPGPIPRAAASAPADVLAFRTTVLSLTGLSGDAVGIVGDGAHQATGGYHEGIDLLAATSRCHPPTTAHVESSTEDYSARTARDHRGLTANASAMDIDYGQRAAIRGINYSPDGTRKLRTDRETGWSVVSSSDSVDIHTHLAAPPRHRQWPAGMPGVPNGRISRLREGTGAAPQYPAWRVIH